jgi:hypothetical protein
VHLQPKGADRFGALLPHRGRGSRGRKKDLQAKLGKQHVNKLTKVALTLFDAGPL